MAKYELVSAHPFAACVVEVVVVEVVVVVVVDVVVASNQPTDRESIMRKLRFTQHHNNRLHQVPKNIAFGCHSILLVSLVSLD